MQSKLFEGRKITVHFLQTFEASLILWIIDPGHNIGSPNEPLARTPDEPLAHIS